MSKFGFGKKKIAIVVAATLVFQGMLPFAKISAAPADEVKLEVKSAILMDAATGQVLYDNNADVLLPPASMAKMMTEYLVMDNIQSGKIKWDDMVTTSQYAADVIGSGDMLSKGEKLSVKDMFTAMSIYSANDASVALAEHIAGGSEENFVKMMNEKAKELGLSSGAHFINSTGLSRADLKQYAPKEVEGETMMTAKDAAKLAYNLLKNHKEVLDFTKIPSQKLRARDKNPMINYNWMLEGNKDNINFKKYAYEGLDGLKTGHTDEAGYCFTATAQKNGMRLISVVMGTNSEPNRFNETRKVLDYGFTNFEKKTVIEPNSTVEQLKTVNVKKAAKLTVPVVTEDGLTLIAKKGEKDDAFVKEVKATDDSKLVAPVKKGTQVGTLKVTYNGQESTIKLVTAEDVEKAGMFRLMFRGIGDFFSGIGKSIKDLF